jgi:hypothetical protein
MEPVALGCVLPKLANYDSAEDVWHKSANVYMRDTDFMVLLTGTCGVQEDSKIWCRL